MTAVNLGLDPIYYATDHCDAIMDAADELRADLRRRAQEIVADPHLLDEALGEHAEIVDRGLAVQRALSGDVTMLRDQARRAAEKYALDLRIASHDRRPPQPVIDEALREGWAPELPPLTAGAQ